MHPARPLASLLSRFLGLLACVALSAAPVHAADGDLDPSFGSSLPADIGRVRLGFGGGNDAARCIARQADGKYVVGAQTLSGVHTEIGMARYFPDGTLDLSFGELGFVRTAIQKSDATHRANDYITAIIAGPSWILVAGLGHAPLFGLDNDFVMARYDLSGNLDPTFGTGGRVITDFFGSSDQCNGMTVQADGKILLVGSVMVGSDSDFGIARYTTAGQLDPTFGGGDGKVNISIGTGDQGQAIAMQDDGKILVTGFANIGSPPSTELTAILRLLTDGSPDPTWDGDGRLTRNVAASSGFECGLAVAIQNTSPQKIVVSGIALNQMSVLRYNLNGTPDNTFSGDGLVLVPGTTFVGAGAIAFETDGGGVVPIRVFIAGDTGPPNSVPVVVKLDLAGNFDPTFGGGDGIAPAPIGTGAGRGLVLAAGAKPVVVGAVTVSGQTDLAVSRLDESGLPDATFDFDGWRSDDMGNAPCRAAAVVHQPDGRILVAGTARIGGIDRFALARLNAFGRLDPTFDGDGRVVTTIGDVSNTARGIALQPDGRIVVVGQAKVSGAPEQWYFAAARYQSNGALDPTFAGDGTTTVAVYGFADARAVALQPDGKIVIAGSTQFGGNANFALVRLDALGVPDPTFDGDGRISTDMGSLADTARAVLVRPDGTIFVAGSALVAGTPEFAAANYHSNGTLDGTFSGDGKATASVDFWSDHAYACGLHGTAGQTVLAGQAFGMKNEGNFGFLQFDIFGVPDPTFGPGGARVHAVGTRTSGARALAVLSNGRVLGAGWSRPFDAASDFTVLRLLQSGGIDNTFAGDGSREIDMRFGSDDVAHAMSIGSNGRVVVAGEAGGVFGLARLTGVDVTGVGDDPRADGGTARHLDLAIAGANPSAGPARLAFDLPRAGEAALAVYDLRGARVRVLAAGWHAAGRHSALWDGRNDAGGAAEPGIYFVRLSALEETRTVRLVRLGR